MDRTEWFYQKKWGIFLHYLFQNMNDPKSPSNMGLGDIGWEQCLQLFDAERFADALSRPLSASLPMRKKNTRCGIHIIEAWPGLPDGSRLNLLP